jgi:hypothetical protein
MSMQQDETKNTEHEQNVLNCSGTRKADIHIAFQKPFFHIHGANKV